MYGSDFVDFFVAFIGIMMILGLIFLGAAVALYVLRSIGLYNLARNRGLPNPWIAWIPAIGLYTQGAISDNINEVEGKTSYHRYFIVAGAIVSFILQIIYQGVNLANAFSGYSDLYMYRNVMSLMVLWLLIFAAGIVTTVFTLISLYKIYQCYSPKNAVLWLVLCIFFAFLRSVFVFVSRNNEPNWINPPPYYPPSGDGAWNGAPPPGLPQGPENPVQPSSHSPYDSNPGFGGSYGQENRPWPLENPAAPDQQKDSWYQQPQAPSNSPPVNDDSAMSTQVPSQQEPAPEDSWELPTYDYYKNQEDDKQGPEL